MRSISPSLMNSGTRTDAPVSSFATFWPPVAVSPLQARIRLDDLELDVRRRRHHAAARRSTT